MPGAPLLILMRGGFHFILMISPYFKPELYEFIYKTCPHNFALNESVKILDFVIGFMRRNSFLILINSTWLLQMNIIKC